MMTAALEYKGYFATNEAAIQDSYLLNLAQGAALQDEMSTGEVLVDYVTGRITLDETAKELAGIAEG